MGFELGFAYGFGSIWLNFLAFSTIHTFVTYVSILSQALNQKGGDLLHFWHLPEIKLRERNDDQPTSTRLGLGYYSVVQALCIFLFLARS